MIGIKGLETIAQLAAALSHGDDNIFEKIILDKFENMGEEALMRFIGGPAAEILGQFDMVPKGVRRFGEAVATGGVSELKQFRHVFQPNVPGLPGKLLRKFEQLYDQTDRGLQRRWSTKWGRSGWAESRNDWLDNKWRHDWRSQPRDPVTGRWLPGRLEYIDTSLMYRGKRAGRTLRTFRRRRRIRRAMARKTVRQILENGD